MNIPLFLAPFPKKHLNKSLEMKRTSLYSIALIVICGLILTGCGGSGYKYYKGELLGIPDRPNWKGINPFGMLYIPTGTFHIGPSDQDVNHALWQRSKSISIQGFYMDETEITNNEYRQFVTWVKDSVALTLLGRVDVDDDGNEQLDWREAGRIDWEKGSEDDLMLEDMYYTEENQVYGKREIDKNILVYDWEWFDWKAAASETTVSILCQADIR